MGPTVVIDTNVLVSGLGWRGPAYRILRMLARGELTHFVSTATLQELARVLAYPKFDFSQELQGQFLTFIKEHSTLVEPKRRLSRITEDPSDNRFLEVAEESQARFLITGDAHLLRLTTHGTTRILTPKAFLEEKEE